MRLFVGQVPKSWDDGMTLRYFQRFGQIVEAKIIREKLQSQNTPGAHKGCAFLKCAYYHEAETIMKVHRQAQKRRKRLIGPLADKLQRSRRR